MGKKALLLLGASSDCGIQILKRIHMNYELIYAHYCHNKENLLNLKDLIDEEMILIQDDFSLDIGGSTCLEVIENKGIWPDHVIHLCAPKYKNYKFIKAKWGVFEEMINISLRSCVVVLEQVIAKMKKEKRDGRIIFMLSSYIQNIPPRFTSPYIVTKYALLGLMKELSAEYCSDGIMVNGVSPSMMETKFLDCIPELIVEKNAKESLFGRNLNVDEAVPVFEFLLSEGASRITGQNIVVSGGN